MDEPGPFVPSSDEPAARRRQMLRSAMGPAIAAALADPEVIEIMVNPDGRLRLDRLMPARSASTGPLNGSR